VDAAIALRLPALERDVQLPGHSNKIGDRHLLHDPASMNLERDFADAELRRRLLVQKAADDQWQHLAFARRERRVALLQSSASGSLHSRVSITRDGGVYQSTRAGFLDNLLPLSRKAGSTFLQGVPPRRKPSLRVLCGKAEDACTDPLPQRPSWACHDPRWSRRSDRRTSIRIASNLKVPEDTLAFVCTSFANNPPRKILYSIHQLARIANSCIRQLPYVQ
jgi:hypothetical protein